MDETHIPANCAPGEYVLIRRYFVANYLDGDETGSVTVKAWRLADGIAELFSSDDWHAVHNDALLAELRNEFGSERKTRDDRD